MGELSENKPFETEIRFFVDDIKEFRRRVDKLKATLLREYSFTDYYYSPTKQKWNSQEKSLRIRVWRQPSLETAIWFSKQEIKVFKNLTFKKSLYEEGKVKLFSGDIAEAQRVLKDLGFEPSYTINKKHGWVWSVANQDLEFCIEDVDGLGWTGEIELDGTDPKQIIDSVKKHQKLLGLRDDQLSGKPLVTIFEEMGKKPVLTY